MGRKKTEKSPIKCALIAAGGTGGHIFPGLVVADELVACGVRVDWLGGERGLERRLVEGRYPLHTLPMGAFRGGGISRKIAAFFQIFGSFARSYRLIKRLKADLVLVMGGYVSAPAGLAAKMARVRLVVHEQNAIPGLANRLLMHIADEVCQAFPDTFKPAAKVVTSGNPLRRAFRVAGNARQSGERDPSRLRVLVVGGSLGARAINNCVLAAMQQCEQVERIDLWHQTGEKEFKRVAAEYSQAKLNPRVEPFINDAAAAFSWADIVVSRAGALSVSELAATGVASLLVPFPYAVDNHQYHNAQHLEKLGAAIIIPQTELSADKLLSLWQRFMQDRASLVEMGERALEFSRPDALELVVASCLGKPSSGKQSAACNDEVAHG